MKTRSAAVALLVLSVLAAGCARKPPPPRPPEVVVAEPLQRRVTDWDDYVGRFTAVSSVDVRPRVSGYVQSLGFRDGQIVHRGQTLFVIDPRSYQAALDQAAPAAPRRPFATPRSS